MAAKRTTPLTNPFNISTTTTPLTFLPGGHRGLITADASNYNNYNTFDMNAWLGNGNSSMSGLGSIYKAGFDCYCTSTDRITEGKKNIIIKLLETSNLEYPAFVKHVGITEKLLNTIILEYTMKNKPFILLELLSHNSQFTGADLYFEVVTVLRNKL